MEFAPRIDNIDKNYLINGSMDLFQRFISPAPFSGVSLTTSFAYLNADRWAQKYVAAGMGATPATCSSTTVPNTLSKYSMNWIVTPTTTNAEVDMYQRIESNISRELSGQVVSFGLMVNSPSASQIIMELYVPQGPDNYTTETLVYTQTVAFAVGSWQQVKFENITLPSTVFGLEVRFRLTNWTLLSGPYNVYLTQFGLTRTPVFDGFNRHGGSLMTEISACHRYYEKSYNLEVNPGTVTNDGNFYQPAGGLTFLTIPFKAYKRASYLLTPYSPDSGNPGVVGSGGGDSSQPAGTLTSLGSFFFELNASFPVRSQWTADAEL